METFPATTTTFGLALILTASQQHHKTLLQHELQSNKQDNLDVSCPFRTKVDPTKPHCIATSHNSGAYLSATACPDTLPTSLLSLARFVVTVGDKIRRHARCQAYHMMILPGRHNSRLRSSAAPRSRKAARRQRH
eukprot:1083523-Pleurochrysis_carterae.AAC.1